MKIDYTPQKPSVEAYQEQVLEFFSSLREATTPFALLIYPDPSLQQESAASIVEKEHLTGGLGKTMVLNMAVKAHYKKEFSRELADENISQHIIDLFLIRSGIADVVEEICERLMINYSELFDKESKYFLKNLNEFYQSYRKLTNTNIQIQRDLYASDAIRSLKIDAPKIKNFIEETNYKVSLFFDSFDIRFVSKFFKKEIINLFSILSKDAYISIIIAGRTQLINDPLFQNIIKNPFEIRTDKLNIELFNFFLYKNLKSNELISTYDIGFLHEICEKGRPVLAIALCEFLSIPDYSYKQLYEHLNIFIDSNKNLSLSEASKRAEAFKRFIAYNLPKLAGGEEQYVAERAVEIMACSVFRVNKQMLLYLIEYISDDRKKSIEIAIKNIVNNLFHDKDNRPRGFVKEYKQESTLKNYNKKVFDEKKLLSGIDDHFYRMHDEIVEMFDIYYWRNDENKGDDKAKKLHIHYRNRIAAYYRTEINKVREYPMLSETLLFEHFSNLFQLHHTGNLELERKIVFEFLFELSYALDSHPQFADRLLTLAEGYLVQYWGYEYDQYTYDESLFDNPLDDIIKTNVDRYIQHSGFAQTETDVANILRLHTSLVRLALRRVEYYIILQAAASPDWKKRSLQIIKWTEKFANILYDRLHNKEYPDKHKLDRKGLLSRCELYRLELDIWTNFSNKAEMQQRFTETLRTFYKTNDIHSVVRCSRMSGLWHQNQGNLELAKQWHEQTITICFLELKKIDDFSSEMPFENFENAYRYRFLLRALSWALGNLVVNYRLRGSLRKSIAFATLNDALIQASSTSRVELTRGIFAATICEIMLGNETESYKYFNYIENSSSFSVPILFAHEAYLRALNSYRKSDSAPVLSLSNKKEFFTIFSKNDDKIDEMLTKILEMNDIKNNPYFEVSTEKSGVSVYTLIDSKEEFKIRNLGNRPLAELYLLVGKALLLWKTAEKNKYISNQKNALWVFISAEKIAESCGATYVKIDALISQLQWYYFVGEEHLQVVDKIKINTPYYTFGKVSSKIEKDFREINTTESSYYYDLRMKFEWIEGEYYFDNNKIKKAFYHFSNMMYYGGMHNQDRYNTAIERVAKRLTYLFETYGSKKLDKAVTILTEITQVTRMKDKVDTGYESYIRLLSDCINWSKQFDEKKLVTQLKAYGDKTQHVKAAVLTEILAQNALMRIEKSENALEERIIRYYQAARSQYEFGRFSTAHRLVKEVSIPSDLPERLIILANATKVLMKTTLAYRGKSLWVMERLLLGEVEYHRRKKEKDENFQKIFEDINRMNSAIKEILFILSEDYCSSISAKSYLRQVRILAEICFRLGELYIIWNNMQTENIEIKLESDNILDILCEFLLQKNDAYERSESNSYAIRYLHVAHALAALPGDKLHPNGTKNPVDSYLAVDALQSIANAYYLSEEVHNKNYQEAIKKVTELCKKPHEDASDHPYVLAKLKIVEGNVCFSSIFEINKNSYNITVENPDKPNQEYFNLKEKYINYGTSPDVKRLLRSKLHEMMLFYFDAMDLMYQKEVPDLNTELHNMLREIMRRISLIQEKDITNFLLEGIEPIWYSFPNLRKHPELLEHLVLCIRIRHTTLKAKQNNKIFFNIND